MNVPMLNDIFVKDQGVFIMLVRTSSKSMYWKVLKSRETTLYMISGDAVSHIGGLGDNLLSFIHALPHVRVVMTTSTSKENF
jgi:hypothetical protein